VFMTMSSEHTAKRRKGEAGEKLRDALIVKTYENRNVKESCSAFFERSLGGIYVHCIGISLLSET
jgi:hypothetical protein